MQKAGFYEGLETKSSQLADGIAAAAARAGYPVYSTRVGSMFCTFFTPAEVYDWQSAAACDTAAFGRYFRSMLAEGIYLAPSQFETAFISASHSDEEIHKTIAAAEKSFRLLG